MDSGKWTMSEPGAIATAFLTHRKNGGTRGTPGTLGTPDRIALPESFFSNFGGQGHFVDINPIVSVSYFVHTYAWTRRGQVDKKKWWDSGTLGTVGDKPCEINDLQLSHTVPSVGTVRILTNL